ncbi:Mad3/BUB1 homology region 1-domain-containing protein [Hygrophoropsis aurantiaca]|uniref:Mad3/BUB1 homology region 1-domain-containing protein n=1 Tax=Hygrophoropsis aurantiaca TaxID=72124 RepID=A0ACB8AJ04_9AGAM|nr:Mad3/BUB1 homology region 1-domain-containing protein [Hygrophoropsis aurantiaca]
MELTENIEELASPESPPVVDCEVLEAAKENIQPLASGRRVTALSAILTTPHAQRDAQLSAARKRHRFNVQIALEDDDDDPLEVYTRFVNWTLDNYPQGQSAESGLLELLEEATRTLKDDRNGRWKGELKYLKLWVLYASFVERPVIIYKFLLANDIGTDHALLYEEHALVLERDGRRSDADAAYLLGIARQATPLERLQSKHAEFQKRMMTAATLPTQSTSDPAPSSSRIRSALATSSSAPLPTPSGSSSRTLGASASLGDVFGSQPARPASNGRLQIFVDPSGSAAQESLDATNPWADVGTRKTRVKENVPELSKAGGTTLKQAGRSRRIASSSSGTVSKIVPFRDPGLEARVEDREMPPPTVPTLRRKETAQKTPARISTIVPFQDPDRSNENAIPSTPKFTPFRDEPETPGTASTSSSFQAVMQLKTSGTKGPVAASEAEALRKDPLKNYTPDEHFSLGQ